MAKLGVAAAQDLLIENPELDIKTLLAVCKRLDVLVVVDDEVTRMIGVLEGQIKTTNRMKGLLIDADMKDQARTEKSVQRLLDERRGRADANERALHQESGKISQAQAQISELRLLAVRFAQSS